MVVRVVELSQSFRVLSKLQQVVSDLQRIDASCIIFLKLPLDVEEVKVIRGKVGLGGACVLRLVYRLLGNLCLQNLTELPIDVEPISGCF